MQRSVTHASLVVLLLLGSSLVTSCLAHLRVGAFNVRVFGQTKVANADVLNILVQIVRRYDILLIQEIRDISETAIDTLVDAVNAENGSSVRYAHTTSERLGRTSYKEQYSYVYRTNDVTLVETYQFNDSANDVFQREPYCAKFRLRDAAVQQLVLIGFHAEPDTAVEEMEALMDVHTAVERLWNTDDILIMGDLNADCRYASARARNRLRLRTDRRFSWLIDDEVDTTTTNTDCTYDRLIVSGDELRSSVVPNSAGVFRFDVEYSLDKQMAERVSDHYPVEVLMRFSYRKSTSNREMSTSHRTSASYKEL